MTPADSALLRKLAIAWPRERWRDVTVLVAVSGGADSVALAQGLCALHPAGAGKLVLAHFNHRLRGAESDGDEAFVRLLAEQHGLAAVVGRAAGDLAAGGSGEGLEGAARQARYAFLAKVAGECGARYIATAHTADDQVETVLFNVLRGTGLAGLAGIPRIRTLEATATIVRPLLDVARVEVLEFLNAIGQPWREDSTNCGADYTRNRIRLELLPVLEREFNPRVRESLLRLSQIAGQAEDFLEQQAEAVLGACARRCAGGIEFDVKRMAHLHPVLVRQALQIAWREQGWPMQDMSYEKWEGLLALIVNSDRTNGQLSPQVLPGGVRVERRGEFLKMTRTAQR